MTTDKCKVGGCPKIGCEGGFYCFNADGTRKVVSEEKKQELRDALKEFVRDNEQAQQQRKVDALIAEHSEWTPQGLAIVDSHRRAFANAVLDLAAPRSSATSAEQKSVATVRVTSKGYSMELSTHVAYALPEGMHELYAAPVIREAGTVPSAKAMADRFLGWRLPDDFRPDCGISFKRTFNEHLPSGPYKYEPTGTNLLTADQALAMFEYCLAAAPAPSCLSHDARECLMDVVSHHHDLRTACIEVKAANETTRSDELYWQKQIDVLDRMKAQAERALSGDDTKAAPDPAPSVPGVVVVQGAPTQALLNHMDSALNDWTMRAARGECGWICADCCQSFPEGMPDKCCCGHQSCTDIITRDKRDARIGEK